MTSAAAIDPDLTLGELVAERPTRADVFDGLGLDYCCGGRQTLAAACAAGGLELETVVTALETVDPAGSSQDECASTDWRTAPLAELCLHITCAHHDRLRDELPRIEALLEKVTRVHGARDPRLHEVATAFAQIRAELEPHLESEEHQLFPACVASEQYGVPVPEPLASEHEHEHAVLGDALHALRRLCDDYDPARALCNTHGALLGALAALERDMHRHVHEENNILLPRARDAAA